MSKKFTTEFRHESACLVLDAGYSIAEACKAMGVGDTAMRGWVKQLASERGGETPVGAKALTAEQQRIQELEKRCARLEREKAILKKATALYMQDSLDRSN